uniref:Ig-like domain-containing protein n=1 Tax=Anser brachyrhynchus TaxID=132585 RepID=A0A8B9I2M8_9AVES
MKMEEGGSAPVFLKQVSDVEVWQGDVARLSVTVTGSPTPKILWFFSDVKLTPSSDCKLVFAGNDHSLILPYVGMQDEGKYTCMASNVHGEAACSAHLHVRQRVPGAPCFARAPDSVQCAPGFTAVFEYTVAGEPCPDVEWFKGTERLFSDARHSVSHNPDGSGSLTVWECMEEDTGLYTCRAVSTLGEAQQLKHNCQAALGLWLHRCSCPKSESSLRRRKALPPTFLTRPESITTFVGKSAKFLCTVSGTPVIEVAWQKDGTTISPSDHHKISKVENKHQDTEITSSAKYTIHFAEGSASLEIKHLDASDAGVYICRATNSAGSKDSSSTLFIKGLAMFQNSCSFFYYDFLVIILFFPTVQAVCLILGNCFLSMQSRTTQLHCRTGVSRCAASINCTFQGHI